MPADLRKAHAALDKAVDKLYRKEGFATEAERVEHLLHMYEEMTAPLAVAARGAKKRARNR